MQRNGGTSRLDMDTFLPPSADGSFSLLQRIPVDKQYFDEVFHKQYAHLGQATVTVHLHGGATLLVESLFAAHDRYVILSVYHAKNSEEDAARMHPTRKEIVYDQIAVPYSSVAYVHATRRQQQTDPGRDFLGFRP